MNNNGIKIVLLNIEEDTFKVKRQFAPPFGILIASTILIEKGYDVVVKHLIEDRNIKITLSELCNGALAVGFSTMTSSNLMATIRSTKIVKSLGYYTFWGGVHPTLFPNIALQEPSLDAILRGEAECNLLNFVLWRLNKTSSDHVAGLCYKQADGKIIIDRIPNLVQEKQLSHHSFDKIDITPYLDKNIEPDKKYINKRMLPFMTSKGCNKQCTFCYNNVINKCTWRGYALKHVFYEMDWLIDCYNVEGWLFYDDNFFVNSERAWTIIERYNMPSFIEIDLNKINNSFMERAKKGNIQRIFIGIESGSDNTLKRIQKGINQKIIREKIKICADMKMNVELSFMILFPNEQPDELRMTFDLIGELQTYKNVSIAGPKIYTPYPDTPLYSVLINSGWTPPASNEDWSKFERNISPDKTGYPLTREHYNILKINGLL